MQNKSDLEKAKLQETVLNACHLFIGDQLPYTEDKEKHDEIQVERDKLWLEATTQAGPFESRVYWLHKELKSAYHYFDQKRPYYSGSSKAFAMALFDYTRDRHAAELLSYLAVAYSIRNNTKDYAKSARFILEKLGCEEGIVDEKAKTLSLKNIITDIM